MPTPTYFWTDVHQEGQALLELLEDFRKVVHARGHLPGLSSLSMLEDIVLHQNRHPTTTRATSRHS